MELQVITIQINLQERTIANLIAIATQQGLSFEEYIEQRLSSDQSCTAGHDAVSTDPVDALAKTLFDAAAHQAPSTKKYLVEDLYKGLKFDVEWESRSPGNRIKLGKAFKRVVEEHLHKPAILGPDGTKVRIKAHDKKTAQNQQLYFTEQEQEQNGKLS